MQTKGAGVPAAIDLQAVAAPEHMGAPARGGARPAPSNPEAEERGTEAAFPAPGEEGGGRISAASSSPMVGNAAFVPRLPTTGEEEAALMSRHAQP